MKSWGRQTVRLYIAYFVSEKKNWQMIDTIHGAKCSAIIYSIVETAKANNLKPFDYVEYLLEEIPKHMDDRDCSFLEDLLPWSENFRQKFANLKYWWLQSSRIIMVLWRRVTLSRKRNCKIEKRWLCVQCI